MDNNLEKFGQEADPFAIFDKGTKARQEALAMIAERADEIHKKTRITLSKNKDN